LCAELQAAFKDDMKLDICLRKCKLYIKGLTLTEAQEEVHKIVEADPALFSLTDILTTHDDPTENVVQVEGMVCVGVPIGSPQFVQAFVAEKSKTMVEDVKKLQLLSVPCVHFCCAAEDGNKF